MSRTTSKIKKITIYVAGVCIHGQGGIGGIMVYGEHQRILGMSLGEETYARASLRAVLIALRQVKEPCRIEMRVSNEFIARAIRHQWYATWEGNHWLCKESDRLVANADLWQEYVSLCLAHKISAKYVGDPRADETMRKCVAIAVDSARRNGMGEEGRI